MGRWDLSYGKYTFNFDTVGLALLCMGVAIVILAVGSEIASYHFEWLPHALPIGLPIQIVFLCFGIVILIFGILLLLVNSGYVDFKSVDYGDDRFFSEGGGIRRHPR